MRIALGSGHVPVLGTPRLVALVELAARSAVADLLDGQTTVGTSIELQHLAASVVGASVRARATIIERTDRRIDFEFEASDVTTGTVVGRGRHQRAVVAVERVMTRARSPK